MGIIGYILGLYWDNGKENGNYWKQGWGFMAWSCGLKASGVGARSRASTFAWPKRLADGPNPPIGA